MKRLKIAVVGTGGRAGAHLSTLPKLEPIYQLVGVCDIDSERAAETAQRMSVSGYTDIETLIEMESPDVILITVGPDGHHSHHRDCGVPRPFMLSQRHRFR